MIKEVLYAYHDESVTVENHRFRSWEHCYKFFRDHVNQLDDPEVLDHASLHLAFYLASWGMLRNSILLQRDYRIHMKLIQDVIAKREYASLFDRKNLSLSDPFDLELLNSLIADTKETYSQILNESNGSSKGSHTISDTLISKILLGVFGVVPAYDRFFREATGLHGINRQFNENSFLQLDNFYKRYEDEFESFIEETATTTLRYTPMKVVDMYFWKVGEVFEYNSTSELAERLIEFISDHKENTEIIVRDNPVYKGGSRTEDIRNYITMILLAEKNSGQSSALIHARDIHKAMNLRNSYPSVCSAMASLKDFPNYDIVFAPPSGKSSTVVYRYYFG